jgi:hypothetical protein
MQVKLRGNLGGKQNLALKKWLGVLGSLRRTIDNSLEHVTRQLNLPQNTKYPQVS